MTTSASLRTGSSRRRSAAIELAIPRWSASGWRWRVSEKRRIRTSSRASRKKTCGRIPRPSSAPRIAPNAIGASPDRTSRTIATLPNRSGSSDDELGQLGQELARQVVDDRVAEVLEELRGGGLAAARQPAQEDDVLALARLRPPRARRRVGVRVDRRLGSTISAGSRSGLISGRSAGSR